jgi:hypothetical protein
MPTVSSQIRAWRRPGFDRALRNRERDVLLVVAVAVSKLIAISTFGSQTTPADPRVLVPCL